jgi:hypothetical protein
MIRPVQQLPAAAGPADLAALYRGGVNMVVDRCVYLRSVRPREGEHSHD